MRHLPILFLIGFLMVLPSCKYFKGGGLFGKKSRANAIMKAQEDSIRLADSLQKVKEHLKATVSPKQDSLKQADEAPMTMESNYRYNIIIGSFITPKYAEAFAKEYSKKGYDPKILRPEGSRFELVSVEAFSSISKAVSRLRVFQDSVRIEAWLYIKK
jgi:phosphotransferase system IIB component